MDAWNLNFIYETGTCHFANFEFTVGVNSKLTMGTAISIIPVLALITILRIFNINSNNARKHKCICYGADYKTFQFKKGWWLRGECLENCMLIHLIPLKFKKMYKLFIKLSLFFHFFFFMLLILWDLLFLLNSKKGTPSGSSNVVTCLHVGCISIDLKGNLYVLIMRSRVTDDVQQSSFFLSKFHMQM